MSCTTPTSTRSRNPMNRRELLSALAMLGGTPAALSVRSASAQQVAAEAVVAPGVASGDPLSDRVILWTRVTPQRLTGQIDGQWRIASDERMQRVIQRGRFRTDAARDFTVKIDATGLKPGETY